MTQAQRPHLSHRVAIRWQHLFASYWFSFRDALPGLFSALCHYKQVKTTRVPSCMTPLLPTVVLGPKTTHGLKPELNCWCLDAKCCCKISPFLVSRCWTGHQSYRPIADKLGWLGPGRRWFCCLNALNHNILKAEKSLRCSKCANEDT